MSFSSANCCSSAGAISTGADNGVLVSVGLRVGVGMSVVGLEVRLGVIVGVGVGDGLSVEVLVGLGVRLGVTVGVGVRVQADVGPGVAVGVRVQVGTRLGGVGAAGEPAPGVSVDVGAGRVATGVVMDKGVAEAALGSMEVSPLGRRRRNKRTANRMATVMPATIAQAGSRLRGVCARGTRAGAPAGLRSPSASLYLGQETQSRPRQAVPW